MFRWTTGLVGGGALLLFAVGCDGGGAGVTGGAKDAAGAIDEREPEPDAWAPRPLTCTASALAPGDLCQTSPCPVRSFLKVECAGYLIDSYGFFATPTGTASVTILAGAQAALLEVAPDGKADIEMLGAAHTAATVPGPGGADDPRVLLADFPGGDRIAKRSAQGWSSEPIALEGVPLDFAVSASGQAFVLEERQASDVYGARSLWLARFPAEGQAPVLVTRDPVMSARIGLDAEGRPTVPYVVRVDKDVVIRRFSERGTEELARYPGPDAFLVSYALRADGRALRTRWNPAALEYLDDTGAVRPLFVGEPFPMPSCNGFTTAYNPDICPSATKGVKAVGEQLGRSYGIAIDTQGDPVFAVVTGTATVGCRWAGSCIETKPCDCNEQLFTRFDVPLRLRLGSIVPGPRSVPDLVLASNQLPEGDRLSIAVSGGRAHVVWRRYGTVYVAVVDAPAL